MQDTATSARNLSPDRRWLPLTGGHNVRDLGGFPTSDGRTTRWGRVFRSGTMTHLKPADVATLRGLGLRTICDLRGNRERDQEPTDWNAIGCGYWSRDHQDSSGNLARLASREEGVDADRFRQAMVRLYGILPFSQEESFRAVFRHLLAGDLPLLFHCAAGKDRTGAMSALLLLAIGVEREAIMTDFLLSNHCAAERIALFRSHPDEGMRRLGELGDVITRPVFEVEAEYLDTMIAALIDRHGTLEVYFEADLGVDAAARERLRDALLE